MNRRAVFAGKFYPGKAKQLNEEIGSYVSGGGHDVKAVGIIAPHAGYIYSGKVAAELYSRVKLPDRFVILSPNHTGMGTKVSLYDEGPWETPLGQVDLDMEIAENLMERCPLVCGDSSAHMMEHSLEVQLPFIQHFRKDFKMVPITISHISLRECEELGEAIALTVKETGNDVLIVASSDMTHYESAKAAKEKDMLAVARVLELDPAGLFETVRANGITMCGVIPATVMLFAAQKLGARKGTLVKYSNSGEVTGDYDEVVGYAGIYVA